MLTKLPLFQLLGALYYQFGTRLMLTHNKIYLIHF